MRVAPRLHQSTAEPGSCASARSKLSTASASRPSATSASARPPCATDSLPSSELGLCGKRHATMDASRAARFARLFAEIFQRDLNPFVIHVLIFGAELLATVAGAVQELDDVADRRSFGRLDPGGASHVDHAVEIEVIDIVEERTHRYTECFIADTQHFGARADWRDMLEAPSAVFQPQARDSGAVQVEPDALGLRAIAAKA